MTVTTNAWVLHEDPNYREGLCEEEISFDDIADDEVLVEPLFLSWEGNISHAIERKPVNIARARREKRIVLGNSGVVRVLRTGSAVRSAREGDVCVFFGIADCDEFGHVLLAHAYDAPGTIGLLARRTKAHGRSLFPIPADTKYSLQQWAAFPVRYPTAWSNWRMAFGAFRLALSQKEMPSPHVFGWGGGTTLAELELARHFGCKATMISGSPHHIEAIQKAGLDFIDRRQFPDLFFDPERHRADADYRKAYLRSERTFLALVKEKTGGAGVSIFLDYIGTPVYRATLRALGRHGVIATAGWKYGLDLTTNRANECIRRHVHVFSHACGLYEMPTAMNFGEENGWMPNVTEVYQWRDVPRLAADFSAGRTESYFPVVAINPV